MALSSLAFSLMTFCTHVATAFHDLPFTTSYFIRGVMQTFLTVMACLVVEVSSPWSSLNTRQKRFLVLRGFAGAMGMYFLFRSLRILPVGEAITIFFISPIFTMLFSALALSEPITPIDGIASIISFIGIVLVVHPSPTDQVYYGSRLTGALSALTASAMSAVAYTTVRHLGRGVHFLVNVGALGIATVILSVAMGGAMSPARMIELATGTMFALASSIFAFIGQCLLTAGLQNCRAGPGVLMRNLDVPIAYLLGLAFLSEKPSWLSTIGSCLVLFGTILVGLRKLFQL